MKRWLLLICNAGLFVAGCMLVGTGLLIEFRLDEDESASVLGLSADDWGEVHFIVALCCTALVVSHLALHWTWISAQFRRKRALAALVPAATAALIIGGLLLCPASPGQSTPVGNCRVDTDDD
jgi:hypothetical protein